MPYQDPPNGGFIYEIADFSPFYYDNSDCSECPTSTIVDNHWNEDFSEFVFKDAPIAIGLKPNERVYFRTCLWDTFENQSLACEEWYLNHQLKLFHVEER